MMWESSLSKEQLTAVLDNAPVAIYVSAVDTWELLYANQAVKELLLKQQADHRITCYEAAGFDKPCPFCNAGKMSSSQFTVREFHLASNERDYLLSGKIIDWEGRAAHIEYITDITEKKKEEARAKELQDEIAATFTSIPCGMGVYRYSRGKISPVFHNPAFFEIMGYSSEHIDILKSRTNFLGVHKDDLITLQNKIQEVVKAGSVMQHTYRVWNDRKGEYRWIRLEGSVRLRGEGEKLLYAVYSDVSEQKRLEEYFQTVVRNLPEGVAVVRYDRDGSMRPEFLSDGFAAMTGMTLNEAWSLYVDDAMAGVHPDDKVDVNGRMEEYIAGKENYCELVYRLKKGGGGYLWVKNTLSIIQSEEGECRVYSVFHDMTKELGEQELIRRQYRELIMHHYMKPGPGALVLGHCNITRGKILEIIDYTDSNLLDTFGDDSENFFAGISSFIVDEDERRAFLKTYLNRPALEAFERGDTRQCRECFIRLPGDEEGRYAGIDMNMVEDPDSGDIIGILTITDVTEKKMTDRILYQLSVTGYDMIVDVNLLRDSYTLLTAAEGACCVPPQKGSHSKWMEYMLRDRVVPRDREQYNKGLEAGTMCERLQKEGAYTFAFSITDENGDIRTKNMTVSAIDLRLGRICLSRTDITDSIREQQGLLNMIAYTFELAGFIDISSGMLTMYTRQTVLENLSPYMIENYNTSVEKFTESYNTGGPQDEANEQFRIETMLRRLEEKPEGYDFLFPYQGEKGLRYKQVNVLWGDENHRTICMVRADVTDMLEEEHRTKNALEKALALAEEANRAKSDFLSDMSHDIRTPMNAIMGMTALARAHIDDKERVADCLQKISISSSHLLSLINDILDMSKIERSKITLNRMKIRLPELTEQLSAIMAPQARAAGLHFDISTKGISHEYFYGDALRINQILINILSNAVKFTPEGGKVEFVAEEIPCDSESGKVCYCFTIRDTGIGMTEEFLSYIFDSFTRSRNAEKIEGTGLGLSITKGLVDLMGGKISVESTIHKGSVFKVRLEFEIVPEEEIEHRENNKKILTDTETGQILAGRRFLVAEDNPINAEILCELLAMYGAGTVVKTDGAQTVQAFKDAPPDTFDAVLMDIQMPVMNGYEATRAIRELAGKDAESIPIIAMTANAFAEDIQASKDAGMTAHVAKPIDVNVLKETLAEVLKQGQEGK